MSEVINHCHELIQKNLLTMKISQLTPIQELCIPVILDKKNVIGLSETGSGKTVAYLAPLLSNLIGKSKKPHRVLIVTPTKELAEQILSVAKKLAQGTTLISTSLYGGKSFSEQENELKKGQHLIVACPGRLVDHIEKKTIDLDGIESLILDEADQLFDMGFRPHLLKIIEATHNKFQTLLFSATMSEEIQLLVDESITNAIVINVNANSPKESIKETFCPITNDLKYPFLRFLFKHHKIKSALLFCNTKEEARSLFQLLTEDKYKVALLEGDMTTHQRKKSLQLLRDKSIHYLVATDVASRGLDIPHVSHVINLSPPLYTDSYIHRIGRTARHDKAGMAVTLYLKGDEHDEEEDLSKILKDCDQTLIPTKFKEFNYLLKIDKKNRRTI
jgi:ATP-dependent RNA helicase RhlE